MFSPDQGSFAGGDEAPARALLALEAYGTDGPFHNERGLLALQPVRESVRTSASGRSSKPR